MSRNLGRFVTAFGPVELTQFAGPAELGDGHARLCLQVGNVRLDRDGAEQLRVLPRAWPRQTGASTP